MTDLFIEQKLTLEIVNDLMHLDDHRPVFSLGDLYGIDVGIYRCPLSCPVGSDRVSTLDMASVHAIRPSHVLSKRSKYRVDIPRVEPRVELLNQFFVGRHRSVLSMEVRLNRCAGLS